MTIFSPKTEEEVASHIVAAQKAATPLRIVGGGTRQPIGRAIETPAILSTKNLTGITLYEPMEMVIAARAGTPLAEIEAELAKNNQMFTFEPMDHRTLLGTHGEPTIGAIVAGNLSGPRRIFGGAVRDSLIGVRFVNGKGEMIKNGGRVMKNVTGLDLVKLQAGAWGTLGVLTEVTFKLLPRPERQITLVLTGLSDEDGVKALCAAAGTPFEPTGLAHLPAGMGEQVARTLIRIEGLARQVAYRAGELQKTLAPYGVGNLIEGEAHAALWRSVRDVAFLSEPRDKAVWRLSVRPTSAPNTVEVIKQAVGCHYYFDWSGGLIWLAVDESDEAGEETIRHAVDAANGHATLIRGSKALRARIGVFEPQPAPLVALSNGIKKSFDPDRLLNPGLMVDGV